MLKVKKEESDKFGLCFHGWDVVILGISVIFIAGVAVGYFLRG